MYCVDCIEEMVDIGGMLVQQVERAGEASTRALRALISPVEDICVVKEGFVDETSASARKKESQRILGKYPNRIPVIMRTGSREQHRSDG